MAKQKKIPVKQSAKGSRKWIFVIILLCFVVLGGEFIYFKKPQLSQLAGIVPKIPFISQQAYNVMVEVGKEKSRLILKEGGEVMLETGETSTYNLSFPANSFLEGGGKVKIQEILAIQNLPEGSQFIKGIHITSEDDFLVKPAKLTIAIPDGVSKKLRGFAYDEEGKAFHLYPVRISENTATFEITHFSGYGIISVEDSFQPPPTADGTRMEAQQKITGILTDIQQRMGTDTDYNENFSELPENVKSEIALIMEEWYRDYVRPLVMNAKSNDHVLMKAAKELMIWHQALIGMGINADFTQQINEGYASLLKGIRNATDKADGRCKNDKDPAQAGNLVKLASLSEIIKMTFLSSGASSFDYEGILQKARNCANFKLTIETEINEPDTLVTGEDASMLTKYYGEIPINLDENFYLSGEGTVESKGQKYAGKHDCSFLPSAPATTVKIPLTKFASNAEKTDVQLIIMAEDVPETQCVITIQPDKPAWGPKAGSTTVWPEWEYRLPDPYSLDFYANTWESDFDDGHKAENIGDNVWRFKEWDLMGKGGVFAKKHYTLSSRGVIGGIKHEKTTIQLIHLPK